MYFDESFFLPEERDGFYVKSMMKRFWASTMETLAEIDRICKKNNIKYFAYYGTLLGAVRHKGFIPWDDDVDIAMLRIDYERFIKCLDKDLSSRFGAINVKTTELYPMRIINSSIPISINEEFLMQFHLCPYATGIDIYVIDRIPDDEAESELLKNTYFVARFLSQATDDGFEDICREQNIDHEPYSQEDLDEILDSFEDLAKMPIDRNLPLAPQIAKITDLIAASYFDSNSSKACALNNWVNGTVEGVDANIFDDIIELPFENITIPAPRNSDAILRDIYGPDYMTPQRVGSLHDYPLYKDKEAELFEFFRSNNIPIPNYLTI